MTDRRSEVGADFSDNRLRLRTRLGKGGCVVGTSYLTKWVMFPIVLSALLVVAGTAFGQDIGSFFVSANHTLGDYHLKNNFTTHKVGDLGIAVKASHGGVSNSILRLS